MIPTYKNVNIEPIIMCQPKINFKMRNNVNNLAKFLHSNKLWFKAYLRGHNGKYHFKTGELRTEENQNRLIWELLLL